MMCCKCDGCGKETLAEFNGMKWFKPSSWFERVPEGETPIQACSRKCIEIIENRRKTEGKQSTKVVLPF